MLHITLICFYFYTQYIYSTPAAVTVRTAISRLKKFNAGATVE